MRYDSIYSVVNAIIEKLGGTVTNFDSVYSQAKYVAEMYGADPDTKWDSIYDILEFIYDNYVPGPGPEPVEWTLVDNEYIVDVVDGQYYQKLVQYGEITQGVSFETPGSTYTNYGFISDTESSELEPGYTYLMSNNKAVSSSWALVKLKWDGSVFDNFILYFRSRGESGYDYLVISDIDAPEWTSEPNSGSANVLAHTKGNPSDTFYLDTIQSGEGEHWIWVAYRKDSSGDSGTDRGYIGFIAESKEILDVREGELLPSTYEWYGDVIEVGGALYQKLVRVYTLPNGSTATNNDDYIAGEEIEPIREYDGLTFEALSDDTGIAVNFYGGLEQPLSYCKLNQTLWNEWDGSEIVLNAGEKLCVKGTLGTGYTPVSKYKQFVISNEVNCYGNIMGLVDDGACTSTTIDKIYAFNNLFNGCPIKTAPSLPAVTLKGYCYMNMFKDCTKLTEAPALPATVLASYCYASMFWGCTSLTTAPALPATSLMYSSMATYCYYCMFYGCTSLTEAPALPATDVSNYCYHRMFYGCTRLTTAPELPATQMANGCYKEMFYNCQSLTEAPALPAIFLANDCYNNMFNWCIRLTEAPALPATTLFNACYREMFCGCTRLTTAPALPATELATECYYKMFSGCPILAEAPILPATTLADKCYFQMFQNCHLINSITTYAEDISAFNCTNLWLYGVADNGDFYNLGGATYERGISGIPTYWTEHTSL